MQFTASRCEIGDPVYPSFVGHSLTLLSNAQMYNGKMGFSKTFQLPFWLLILYFYIFCIAVNLAKHAITNRSSVYLLRAFASLTTDHFLIMIGKCIISNLYQIHSWWDSKWFGCRSRHKILPVRIEMQHDAGLLAAQLSRLGPALQQSNSVWFSRSTDRYDRQLRAVSWATLWSQCLHMDGLLFICPPLESKHW